MGDDPKDQCEKVRRYLMSWNKTRACNKEQVDPQDQSVWMVVSKSRKHKEEVDLYVMHIGVVGNKEFNQANGAYGRKWKRYLQKSGLDIT